MHENQFIRIIGSKTILVPYREHHVEKYHKWMESEYLQTLTASEPLTLDEEYQMQKSWHKDSDKCTFIILDKSKYEDTKDEIESMIGDTNFFFANEQSRMTAEVEIMIAEEELRGKHLGWEAIILMIIYGINNLGVQHYIVKVKMDNLISINLFKKLGFLETGRVRVFNEITMENIVDDKWLLWLNENVGSFMTENDYN